MARLFSSLQALQAQHWEQTVYIHISVLYTLRKHHGERRRANHTILPVLAGYAVVKGTKRVDAHGEDGVVATCFWEDGKENA